MFVFLVTCTASLLVADEGDAARTFDVNLTLEDTSSVRVATWGDVVIFNFTIEHNGTAPSEEVVIEILNASLLWHFFLTADPQSGVETGIGTSFDFLLVKDEIAKLTVTFSVPVDALEGTYWFTFLAYPQSAPSHKDSCIIGVIVRQRVSYDLILWDPPPEGTYMAQPSSKVSITYALYNTGNGADRFLINGSSSGSNEGWTITFMDGIDEDGYTISIPADPSRTNPYFINISVEVPAGTVARVKSSVYLNSTSLTNPDFQHTRVWAWVEVLQFFMIELTGDITTQETVPGGNLEFVVDVRNTGNGLDSIVIQEIEGMPPTWLTYTQPPEVTLLQNQTADIKIIVIVPSRSDEAPDLSYTLTIRARSSRSDAAATLDLVVNITPFNRIEWTYRGEEITNPERPSAQPGSIRPQPEIDLYSTTSLILTMGIENFGNIADDVVLDVKEADTMIEVELSKSILTVASGTSEDVVITIRVPPNMSPGIYSFTLRAQSRDIAVQLRSVPIDVLVISVFPLSDFEALEYTDPVGDDYTFYFEAQAKDGTTPKSSGKVGLVPGIDIVSLDTAFDPETRMVTVEVVLSETLVDAADTYCYVYFVTENHTQGGPLLKPERYNRITPFDLSFNGSSGVLVWWEYYDGDVRVVVAGDVPGAIPLQTDLSAQVDGNMIVFTISDEVLRMGVVPGSGYGLYAFVHTTEYGEGWTRITWDSAGVGAAAAPDTFRIEDEEAPLTPHIALVAIALAVVVMTVLNRRRGKYPEECFPAQ